MDPLLPPGATRRYLLPRGSIPPCPYTPPGADRPCGQPSSYAFRMVGWDARHRAAVCAVHADVVRRTRPVACMWGIGQPPPPGDHGQPRAAAAPRSRSSSA